MAKYRKKPVVIDAWHNIFGAAPTPQWLSDELLAGNVRCSGGPKVDFTIKTLEGEMRADYGDWIIRGVKGELYPCKADIFAATYEPVEEGA